MPATLLAHNVFFALHDASPAARQKLVDSCHKLLAHHPGIAYFACGTRAEELKREVNDLAFDVGLHIVFTDQAAHDRYQDAPDHHAFVAANKANWKQVRVFDSIVTAAR
jgi:hypothetical protein